VNLNGKQFIKFTKDNSYQEKKQNLNDANHVSYASNANASYVSHMFYHEFDASYVLMRNKFGTIVPYMLGLTTSGQRLMCGYQNVLSLT
jgi:hypothetical protein